MEEKKKHGSNYTSANTEILLELVKKYQNILENKETNALMISKKRETWDAVCQQYNSVCTSGPRTWLQLRHLYENMKQRSQKNIAVVNRIHFYENTKEIKKKASQDKKEINTIGGGPYQSSLSEHDAQILAMVGPQIQPLPNPFDDAAEYFGDVENENIILDYTTTNQPSTSKPDCQDSTISNFDEPSTSAAHNILSDDLNTTIVNYEATTSTEKTNLPGDQGIKTMTKCKELCRRTYVSSVKLPGRVKQSENLKQKYFREKLRNAKLERKLLINKNKMVINKYNIEMEILKFKLSKLKTIVSKKR